MSRPGTVLDIMDSDGIKHTIRVDRSWSSRPRQISYEQIIGPFVHIEQDLAA